ncbi:MAG: ATP-dependent helicase, partial [Vicinamibacterales bacterium]
MPSLALTPRGHLLFTVTDEELLPPSAPLRRLESAFGRGSGHGLFELGAREVGSALSADLSYWRDFGARLVTAICTHPDLTAQHTLIPAPALSELEALAAAAPPMTGAEYLTASVLETLWTETATAFRSELAESKASVQA